MYPVPAVQTMAQIAEATEPHLYKQGSILIVPQNPMASLPLLG